MPRPSKTSGGSGVFALVSLVTLTHVVLTRIVVLPAIGLGITEAFKYMNLEHSTLDPGPSTRQHKSKMKRKN